MIVIKRFFKYISLALMILVPFLYGCSSTPEPKVIEQESPVIDKQRVEIETEFQNEPPPKDYTVGPNDVLFINVSGKSEMSSMIESGLSRLQGSRIDGNGNVHLPLVGSIHIDGLTVEQIENKLRKSFSKYIHDPWIVAEITNYKSKPLYLLGQFKQPDTYYMDRPLDVLQGISFGQGPDISANLRGARIIRDNKLVVVDIYRLLMEGDMSQNIWLQAGDSIYFPDVKDQKVFVIGLVNKPGPVSMIHGELTLLQALAAADFDEKASYSSDIRIIRSLSPTRGELIIVDLDKILRGESGFFQLREDDIVFVAHSGIGNWNKAMNEILPTLQAISSLLTPFVQIKYLTD
jgi:polysaccharide export outer membrane protein